MATAETIALLQASNLDIDFGCELLDASDVLIGDITEYLAGGTVERNHYAPVQGIPRLEVTQELDWTAVRLAPYAVASADGYSERFPLGVCLPFNPRLGSLTESGSTYALTCYDKVKLLDRAIGDTYFVAAGTDYITAAVQLVTDSGITGAPTLFDSAAVGTVLPDVMEWPYDPASPTTWLTALNHLFDGISYRPVWADESGRYRSEPYVDPRIRAADWTFYVSDPAKDIVSETGAYDLNPLAAVNYWRFWLKTLSAAPVEGVSQYTLDETGSGLKWPRCEAIEAANYAALEAEALKRIAADKQKARTITIATKRLVNIGHLWRVDVEGLSIGTLQCEVRSHTIPLDGSDMNITLEIL